MPEYAYCHKGYGGNEYGTDQKWIPLYQKQEQEQGIEQKNKAGEQLVYDANQLDFSFVIPNQSCDFYIGFFFHVNVMPFTNLGFDFRTDDSEQGTDEYKKVRYIKNNPAQTLRAEIETEIVHHMPLGISVVEIAGTATQ